MSSDQRSSSLCATATIQRAPNRNGGRVGEQSRIESVSYAVKTDGIKALSSALETEGRLFCPPRLARAAIAVHLLLSLVSNE